MRHIGLILVLLLVFVVGMAAAQEEYSPAVLKRLGLDEAQASGIAEILDRGRADLQKAQAEINVQKAVLSRLLLSQDPDMQEVERVLRAAMEQEVTIRLVQIRRELAVRKLIGDRRWAELRALVRQQAGRQGQRPPTANRGGKDQSKDERVRSLLKELQQLLGDNG